MQHNNHTPNQTNRTPHPAQHPQPLPQKVTPQHGANKHTQRPERRDQNRRRKGVGAEIADLAHDHRHDPRPPGGIFEVGEALALEAVALGGGVEAFFRDHEGGADA